MTVPRRTNRMDREEMERVAREAMADPEFVADMRNTQAAFQDVDAENWPASSDRKTPLTRLLDMTLGWSEFAQKDEFTDEPATVDRICDLYQEAGNLDVGADEPGDPDTEAAIRGFLLEQVLPALVHGR